MTGEIIQKVAFLSGEGDKWFSRNSNSLKTGELDPVMSVIDFLGLKPASALEIGAANGHRLASLRAKYSCEVAGIEPSKDAVNAGNKENLNMVVGTADILPFKDNQFDLVIFGFCAYLIDPESHFRAFAEADRVLKNNGFLVIFDFLPPKAYSNEYSHLAGLRANKMQFSSVFFAHPFYNLIHRQLVKKSDEFLIGDNREAIDVLIKDTKSAFSLGK